MIDSVLVHATNSGVSNSGPRGPELCSNGEYMCVEKCFVGEWSSIATDEYLADIVGVHVRCTSLNRYPLLLREKEKEVLLQLWVWF